MYCAFLIDYLPPQHPNDHMQKQASELSIGLRLQPQRLPRVREGPAQPIQFILLRTECVRSTPSQDQ